MRWLLVALLLAAGCGTGTDGKPVAPPTSPAPAPALPPTFRAVAQVVSRPSETLGYYEYDEIQVLVDFEDRRNVIVEGSPRLAIEIGEHLRLARFAPWPNWPPEEPRWGQRFVYVVGPDDEDADGISIAADAFDFAEGALLNEAGVEIQVEIYAVASAHVTTEHVQVVPGENLAPHPVIGQPEPRVCTTELEHALAFRTVLTREWSGEPFVFYFDTTSLPEAHREDAEHILATVERLSERIEEQIGYSVVEIGGFIEAPVPGPDCNARYRRWRRPGQVVAQVIPELWRDRAGRAVEAIVSAEGDCATVNYWGGYVNIQRDSIIPHELYHLFGFEHSKLPLSNGEPHPVVGTDGVGVRMSPGLTGGTEPPHLGVNFNDVDALRCIFPEGG